MPDGNSVVNENNKEIVKDVYTDIAKPVAQPLGETMSLIPRAVKAALAPLEKWIMQKEYNIAETKKFLEEELKKKGKFPVKKRLIEGFISRTDFGEAFCNICLDSEEVAQEEVEE